MARWRFLALALLALTVALVGSSVPTRRSIGQELIVPSATLKITDVSGADDRSYSIYSLSDMGYDADFGKWIAETIPEVIEPNSWQKSGGPGVLRYNAAKNYLIVSHSAGVQAKVDGFLRKVKTSLPKGTKTNFAANKKSPHAGIVPASYSAPVLLHPSNPVPEASSYPVPAPVKPPKHLFHFLIRYEGEGIIDDNVVKYMKVQAQGEKKNTSDKEASPPAVTGHSYSPATSPSPVPVPPGAVPVYNGSSGGTPSPSPVPQEKENKPADKKAKEDKYLR